LSLVGQGPELGSFYPENPVLLELQSSVIVVCARDVGSVACDQYWQYAEDLHYSLASRYAPDVTHAHMTNLYVYYNLIAQPSFEEELLEENQAFLEAEQEAQNFEDELQALNTQQRLEFRSGTLDIHEGEYGIDHTGDLPRPGKGPPGKGPGKGPPGKGPPRKGPPGKGPPQQTEDERQVRARVIHEDELRLRDIVQVNSLEVDTLIADVVTDTMIDMVDMVELMENMEEEMQWRHFGELADSELDEDHAKFNATLEQLFKAQKVEVPVSDINLQDHMDPEKLMMADLTAEENTPFTQPIRALVERFGQTILMIEDLEESIVSLEELEQAVKMIEKVAPAKTKEDDGEKLHHRNTASMGPIVNDATQDLPPPDSVKPQGRSLKAGRSRKPALPKVTKPVETWPERSYAITDTVKAPAASVSVSLGDLMKAKEQVATDAAAEEEILMRLYEYIHDKTSTLKQVFMEFDRDGSGAIDEEELYYALRHLGFMIDFGECKTIIHTMETRAAELEQKFDNDHDANKAHMARVKREGGYERHVDGKIDYKELITVLNDVAKRKGVLRKSSRFTTKGTLKKRAPGSSILGAMKGASKIKGVRQIHGLNSLYRTHARITGKVEQADMVNIQELDVIGPINAVEFLEPDEYGLRSADGQLYPVRADAAAECTGLLASHDRCLQLDADASTVQTIVELVEGLTLDDTQLHKNTLRKMHGDMITLLVAACMLENMRMFICAVDKVVEGDADAQHELGSMQEMVADSFAMTLPADEWHKTELSLGGVAPAMDLFWFSRCQLDFNAEDDITACKGMWKQIYCELRFQKHLRAGVDHVLESEMRLWDSFIGPLVQTVDLSETGCHNDTVAVCVAYCPNIKYLDLHDTKVTDLAITELVEHLPDLVWINIEETAITGDGVENLVQAFPKLELVG